MVNAEKILVLIICMQFAGQAFAGTDLAVQEKGFADTAFITVDQRLRDMDKNSDGIVSVYEVRSFIEASHGKSYQQDVLDDMESSASGKSCSTPFAKSLY